MARAAREAERPTTDGGHLSGVNPQRLSLALAAAASAVIPAATTDASAATTGATAGATAAAIAARRTARESFLHSRAAMSRRRTCVGRIAKTDGLKVTAWLDLSKNCDGSIAAS